MNYFQKHYGTGFVPILAVILILGLCAALVVYFVWWVGLTVLVVFAFIFWTQRNTL